MSANPAARPHDTVHRGLAGIVFDESHISDIRGKTGELCYRGYAIEELATDPNFENVAYLLLRGDWPSDKEAKHFRDDLASRRALPAKTGNMIGSLKDVPLDDALRTAISALDLGQHDDRDPLEIGLDLIAKVPSMIVVHQAIGKGQEPPIEPDPTLDHASDFLRRLLGRQPTAIEQEIMNLDFVLHADHGANASTFAARVVASTDADMVAAVTAAVSAFVGPLHGGAVAAASRMLAEIKAPEDVPAYVAERRRQDIPIYGFGHRVYRTRDPRSEPYWRALQTLADRADDRTSLTILKALVDTMAPYRRMGIDVNVDLYATAIYRQLGLPPHLATGAFIAARTVGWVAQILEQRANNILIRPRLRYVGPEPRRLDAGKAR